MKGLPANRDLILAFLQAFDSERLCATCLATRLGIDVYAARETRSSLTTHPAVVMTSAQCSACGRRAKTLQYDGGAVASRLLACRVCELPLDGELDPVFPDAGGV